MKENLTQAKLQELVTYEPDTGLFYWRQWKSGRRMDKPLGSKTGAGYLVTTIDYKQYSLHRLAFLYMEGKFPEGQVDHIDNNKLKNKWSNLRHATMFENAQNKLLSTSNTSGFKGVCWDECNNRWKASINYQGKPKHIGMFRNKEDAIEAVRAFRTEVHSEFANHG